MLKWGLILGGGLLVLLAVVVPLLLLFLSPWPTNYDGSWLAAVRDVSIIYASVFMCVGAILFIAMTAAIGAIAFLTRDRIAPALEKADDTLKTVRGTATFVSESVVAPIIKVAGAAAGTRAMVQTLVRQRPPRGAGDAGKEQKS